MSNYIITTLQTAVSVGFLSGYVRYSLHQAFEMLFFWVSSFLLRSYMHRYGVRETKNTVLLARFSGNLRQRIKFCVLYLSTDALWPSAIFPSPTIYFWSINNEACDISRICAIFRKSWMGIFFNAVRNFSGVAGKAAFEINYYLT